MPAEDDLPETEPKNSKKPKPQKAAPVEREPEPVSEPPKKHVHSSRLVAAATDLGFTQQDLDNFPSAEIWEEIHRIQEGARQQPKVTDLIPAKKDEPVDEDAAYLVKLKEEGYTETFIAREEKRLKREKAEDEKAARIEHLEKRNQIQDTARANARAEKSLIALGKKFAPLVGEGEWADLTDPGQRGWRQAIFKEAGMDFTTLLNSTQATIDRKVKEAATKLAKGKVEEEDETDEASPYLTPKKKPLQDPESGRFTVEQFGSGKLLPVNGKKTVPEELTEVEGVRQILRQNGDPRGFRPVVEMGDDLPD